MKSRKSLTVVSSLAALAALLTVGLAMSAPTEVNAFTCHPHVSYRNIWGMGASCSAAEADLIAAGQAAAEFTCGKLDTTPCSVNVTQTNSCYLDNGSYKVDGTVAFQCTE